MGKNSKQRRQAPGDSGGMVVGERIYGFVCAMQ